MGEVLPLPSVGDVFLDVRGDGRSMRVSYHEDGGTVVMSLWSGAACRGTFRMDPGDVSRLVAVLDEMRMIPSASPAAEGQGPDAASAVAGPADDPAPSLDTTGDISGTVNSLRLSSGPVLRIA